MKEIQFDDRVVVPLAEGIVKGRVVSTLDDLVFVAFKKNGEALAFNKEQVFPLYRYMQDATGQKVGIEFLFEAGTSKYG